MILMSCGYEKTFVNHLGILNPASVAMLKPLAKDFTFLVFFSSSFKASASLAYITPWAFSTRYFVNHI